MRWTAAALTACAALAPGCAYFNGVYNARAAERDADALWREGREAEAGARYAAAAAAAETVLMRHPRSRWADDALYIAGRAGAYAGQCDVAGARLDALLATPQYDARRAARARLASGICQLAGGDVAGARALFGELAAGRGETAAEAALWAGRAALRAGRRADARRYFERAGRSGAEWELVAATLADSAWTEAAALLAERAAAGDFRMPDAPDALRALVAAGRADDARRAIARFEQGPLPAPTRPRLMLAAADMEEAAGDAAAAEARLRGLRGVGGDSAAEREAATRLAILAARRAATLDELPAPAGLEDRDPLRLRLDAAVLLARLLAARGDAGGAGLFLAAEVARDSLRAPRLALSLLRRAAARLEDAPTARMALLAQAALAPDSAEVLLAAARRLAPADAEAADPGRGAGETDVDPHARRLATVWREVTAALADSLRGRGAVPPPPRDSA